MNKKAKLCLAIIATAFTAAYVGMVTRPLPPTLAFNQLCQSSHQAIYQSCYIPVPTFASLLP